MPKLNPIKMLTLLFIAPYRRPSGMMVGILFISLIFALGCEPATNDEFENSPFGAALEDKPLQEIIAQTFVLSNFEAMLVATRVSGEMQSPPYTVIAPWDYAFKKLPYWTKITRNRAWYGHLRDLALGHIHEGNLPSELVEDDTTVTMLNGDTATLSKESSRIRVDGERVIGDTAASDGYIYLLDKVHEPKWVKRTVLTVINEDERFSILAQILNHPSMSAKREQLASTSAELTFFALTNEALAGFDIQECEDPDCSTILNQLIENHVVNALVPKNFTPTQTLETQSGSMLDWKLDTQTVSCTNADKSLQEMDLGELDEEFASNGIVQPINAPLCTPIDLCGSKDSDGDGTADCEDECPVDPDKSEPGVCGCGITDVDSDGDGVLDCLDIDPSYECEIVCADRQILSDDCEPLMFTPGESLCEIKRDTCCVEDISTCPTLCDEDELFDADAYIHANEMTCRDYMDGLTPVDFDCVDPYPHVPEVCCKSSFPSSPPVDPDPCYDFCGEDLQMVGSRLLDDYSITCFDYASSLNADSEECTVPDPSIVSQCCDAPQPLPNDNTGNICCLCGGCYGGVQDRYYLSIGADNLTCVGLDFDISIDLKKSDAECTAKKEAFTATCCDPEFTPPPPVPQKKMDTYVSPCSGPNATKDWCAGGNYPTCNLCKNGSYPKNPYTITAVAYIPGNPNCADLYWMGLYNHLPAAMCYPIQNFMEEPCGCL